MASGAPSWRIVLIAGIAIAVFWTADAFGASLSINNVTVAEGNSGTTTATFTVTRSNNTGSSTVDFQTVDDTATSLAGPPGSQDYVATSGTLSFVAGGATTQQIQVLVNGDTAFESNQTFNVLIDNATNGDSFTDTSGLGTITNDDLQPTVSVDDAPPANEGNAGESNLSFRVFLTNPEDVTSTITVQTSDGTATLANSDYQQTSRTLSFPPFRTERTVNVPVNGDGTIEPDETVNLNITSGVNLAPGDLLGTGTILDDDLSALSVSDASVTEGNGGTATLSFTVTLAAPNTRAVTVQAATADGSANAGSGDYVPLTQTLTFNPGDTTQHVAVAVNGDGQVEGDETLSLDLSNALGASIADPTAVGTILNDDQPPTPPAPTPPVPAPTVQKHDRTLKASYKQNRGLFKGKLRSNEADCVADQKVKVFEKRHGADKGLGGDRTDAKGKWKVPVDDPLDGSFYARVKESGLSNGDTCLAAKSKTLKL
jgi:hypothetical protein